MKLETKPVLTFINGVIQG